MESTLTALIGVLLGYGVVGLVGNAIILAVYYSEKSKGNKVPYRAFIKVLAVVDLQVCVLIIPYTIAYEMHVVRSDIACRLIEFIRHFFVIVSNLTLCAIAVERYYAVCKPTSSFHVNNTKTILVFILTFGVLFAIPASFMFEKNVLEAYSELHFNKHIQINERCRQVYGSTA